MRAPSDGGLEATLERNAPTRSATQSAGRASSWRTSSHCCARSSPVRQVRGPAVDPDVRVDPRISRALVTTRPDWLACELRAC
jgi:hypothetical protein